MVNRQFPIVLCIVVFCAHISNGLKIRSPMVVKPSNVESKPNTVQESKPNTVQESKPNAIKEESARDKELKRRSHKTHFQASDFAAGLGIVILPLALFLKEDKKFSYAVLIISVFMGLIGTYHKWYLVGWKLGHHPSKNSILLCVLVLVTILLGIGIHQFDKESHFMIGFFTTLLIVNIPYQIMLIAVTNKNPLFVRIPVLMTLSIIGGLICTTEKKYIKKYSKPVGIGLISAWMFVGGIEHFGARFRWWHYMALSPEPKGFFFRNPKIIFTREYIHPFLFLFLWLLLTPITSYCRFKHETIMEIILSKTCPKKVAKKENSN